MILIFCTVYALAYVERIMPAVDQSPTEALPGVWRASDMAAGPSSSTTSSGDPALDQQLPGGGWPLGSLVEILQPQPGLHEWQLLRRTLRAAAERGVIALVASPHLPNLAALSLHGIPPEQLLLIEASAPAERLWATEQVLRCADVAAVLSWLPQVRSEQLRRLQLATAGHGHKLAIVFRPLAAQHESSPAPLRVAVRSDGVAGLTLQLLKRRGPPLDKPLPIAPALPALLPRRLPAQRPAAPSPVEMPHAVDRVCPPERRHAAAA